MLVVQELTPREEQIVDEIREALEIKLVEIKLCSDIKIRMHEHRWKNGTVEFGYELTTQYQRYDVITVIADRSFKRVAYKMIFNIKETRTNIFADHRELIEAIYKDIKS
jgi:hypothetical protein